MDRLPILDSITGITEIKSGMSFSKVWTAKYDSDDVIIKQMNSN